MPLLDFTKPPKVAPSEEHNERYSSDSGIPGTYVPNMSIEDRYKWKAKVLRGKDPRVEIRKTLGNPMTQVLLVVRKSGVALSANGKMNFTHQDWINTQLAVMEALECL